jgi:glutamate synthase (ferredoxin)
VIASCFKVAVFIHNIREEQEEIESVRKMIERHAQWTGSRRACELLESWDRSVGSFVKVIPNDYKRMLIAMKKMRERGLDGEEAVMAAFEENARDLARIGGG